MTRLMTLTLMAAVIGFAGAAYAGSCGSYKKAKSEKMDIVATADKAGAFKTLLAAAKAAGLVETLQGDGPLTVFAPTDEAFAKLPEGTVATLLKPENKDQLVAVLTYHVVAGKIYSDKALEAGEATTVQGGSILIEKKDDGVFINNARLVKADVKASNGVIHVIDTVLLPPADATASTEQ
jgi:transforming growth factor-beta-induced protein